MAKVTTQSNKDRIRVDTMERAMEKFRPGHRPKMKLRGKQRKKALTYARKVRLRRLDDFADYMGGMPDWDNPGSDSPWD